MNPGDIRPGRTYTDDASAVRSVRRITSLGAGEHEYRAVIYLERAGMNRGREVSMPLDAFARFARRTVAPMQIAPAIDGLGLAAFPIDRRTRDLAMMALDSDGVIPVDAQDVLRLEKLVGLGLADRDGPRLHAASVRLRPAMMAAAERDAGLPRAA